VQGSCALGETERCVVKDGAWSERLAPFKIFSAQTGEIAEKQRAPRRNFTLRFDAHGPRASGGSCVWKTGVEAALGLPKRAR